MAVNELQCTLLTDGASDEALMPIIRWLLREHVPHRAVQANWADLRHLRKPPRRLHERIQAAVALYSCDIVFVHRDAETASLEDRQTEITNAVNLACGTAVIPPAVAVVPVRMMETWLLLDEEAIRQAAGNPNGAVVLKLPRRQDLENIPDPKTVLHRLILDARELPTRRKECFDVNWAVRQIPKHIGDLSALRCLPACSSLEERVVEIAREHRWQE
ncbi:MAG: hypothetical protein NTZ17_21150 [Phycisphaerae bacterium]|nr:hypothetical protein [Phycisphaerae bacterium]